MSIRKRKALVVVAMQNAFVSGELGTAEARAIVPAVAEKVKNAVEEAQLVVFTQCTCSEQQGGSPPDSFCAESTQAWQLIPELEEYGKGRHCMQKTALGCLELGWILGIESCVEVEMIGVRTDIDVVSGALVLKTQNPDWPVCVDSACCAGSSPESHKCALEIMKMCGIEVK